mgnify:CR=1 FL=1
MNESDAMRAARRPLRREDVKTLTLAALGGALEFYDFVIFVFLATIVGQLFFPPDMAEWLRSLQTFGLFAAGDLARPLGGIIMAHFGDRHGRKRMFTRSVGLMALPTLAIGLLPTYAVIGYAAPLVLLVCLSPSMRTRTEMTAGFTLATMSAKPTGALSLCACSVRF